MALGTGFNALTEQALPGGWPFLSADAVAGAPVRAVSLLAQATRLSGPNEGLLPASPTREERAGCLGLAEALPVVVATRQRLRRRRAVQVRTIVARLALAPRRRVSGVSS